MTKQFSRSMYDSHEALYKAKAEHLQECIDWALRANRVGMVGFVPSLLRGNFEDLDTPILRDMTLRGYIEAVEKEDAEEYEDE